jgi:hypothetical protein
MNLPPFAKTLLRVVISLVLIVFLVSTQNIQEIKNVVVNYNPIYLLFGLILILLGTCFSALRWQQILQTSGFKLPWLTLFSYYLRGYFYNNFLPTQLGGDFYKAVAVGNKINDKSVGLFSVFIDRFSGLLVLLVIGFIGVSYMFGPVYVLASIVILAIGLALYFPVLKMFSKKIKFFKKFYDASLSLVKNKKSGAKIIFYSLIIQVFSYSMTYVLFLGAGVVLPLWSVLAFMPLSSLVLLIPSFNGFGTQDLAYVKLFGFAGVTAPVALTVSIMVHVVRLIMSLIGGVFIMFNVESKK